MTAVAVAVAFAVSVSKLLPDVAAAADTAIVAVDYSAADAARLADVEQIDAGVAFAEGGCS